ncbi:hypothetical protein BN14_04414 [Rhizoctonia solani AG-1 IB]|uniref:Uncharacterized protein n=1 Tax=Thanatephorus cucumeris (strain AG1-IB / isolate 7/3/14) TaxID=1108050 RepID=M5BT32_THACB|nr:hypothetical protein BN14_04414 [Rhizoctonia solani AG-1 IB]
MTFTLTLPDGTASADFHLPTPPMLMGPLSAPILGETDLIGFPSIDWIHASGPWTMAEGVSPLRAEAAQGVGSLRSHPSSPESSTHNPYFPPLPQDQPPQAASPVGALHPDLSDALPHRQAAGSRPSIDARGLLQGPRQQLHHSASDPQLHHHARARAVASGASIGVGMYSPLSRQHWLPQDTTMGMGMIDRPEMEMGMGPLDPLASHLDSGLGLHPRPPSTELDGAESGSGSDPGLDATSRLSAEVDTSFDEMDMRMSAIMARGDMNTQRMTGMPSDWPLAMLLHPPTGPQIHRWNHDVESLEAFTQENPTERSDFYRPTGEDTTRRFPTIHRDSLPASGRMTLGLEMPADQTQGLRLDDLPSWNYAQPSPHQMIMAQGLHSAFRPMASPPLSGDGSPRPSFDLRLSAAGIAAGYPGLPASAIEPSRTRYMSEPGPFPSDQQQARSGQRFATPTGEGTRFPHHPLRPQQPWDAGMMTVSNGLGLGSRRAGSSEMTPPPMQVNENANANDYSNDGIQQLLEHANPTTDTNGERAYPTPLSAHPRLPVTGENASGSEVKFEHQSPRLLPLTE